jgi:hypothetical protein
MTTPVLDPTEVLIGLNNGPGIYIAPPGTAGPADLTSPWPAGWSQLGYLSDDGVKITSKTNSDTLTPWQSTAPIRKVITGKEMSMQFTLWQTNAQTLALYFDVPVPTVTGGIIDFDVRTDSGGILYSLGLDILDQDVVTRITLPRGSLGDTGDVAVKRGEAMGWDCTLTALDENGVLAHILSGKASGTATGATAGTPGSFTPANSLAPANLAAMSSIVASPTTAWTTGEYVVLGDTSHAYWDNSAWTAGQAP